MIKIENLSFSYGSKQVLEDVSFSARSGEVVGILGNNGAGKSTLITCINGIRHPSHGAVIINGRPIADMRRREIAQCTAYVPQRPEIVHMSVFDSILLGRKPYFRWGASGNDVAECMNVIKLLGLEKLELAELDELSGGELQKVMIARALVQKPDVLLLDEPTSSLDPHNQYEMMGIIRDVAKRNDITVLAVLHDLNLALRCCDSLFFLKDGKGFCHCDADAVDSSMIAGAYGVNAKVLDADGRRFVMID